MRILTTVPEVLDRAAHIIEQRGWIQGDSEDCNGVCLTHALLLATDASSLRYNIVRAPLNTALGLPHLGSSLMLWNDAPGRTKDEVIKALRDTAERVRRIQHEASHTPQIRDTINGVWLAESQV